MHSLETIHYLNAEATQIAKAEKRGLAVAERDGEIQGVPLIGDYTPEGWQEVETLFVDISGFGSPGEPALTQEQFLSRVKAGFGYGLGECGQFQGYVRVFERID